MGHSMICQVKSQGLPGALTSKHIASPETQVAGTHLTGSPSEGFILLAGSEDPDTAGSHSSLLCSDPQCMLLCHVGMCPRLQTFNLGCTHLKARDTSQEAQGHSSLTGTCTDLQPPSGLCASLASCTCPRDQQDLLPSPSHSGPSPLHWRRRQL